MATATRTAAAVPDNANPLDRIGWRTPGFLALAGLFFAYYFWIVQPGITRGMDDMDYYKLLTEAFLAGQTNLLVDPSPELLKLSDPYNPELNKPYRVHDVSLYGGRYYLYFGAAPAVTLFVPFRLLTGVHLPQHIGCFYFAFLAFLTGCLLLKALLRELVPRTRVWVYYAACAALGFVNSFPHLLRRPTIYETAIASGQFFLMCGFGVLLLSALRTGWATRRRLILGGIALGLTFASRPTMILVTPAAVLLLLFPAALSKYERRRNLAWFATGFAAIAICVGIYNWVRFDNPLRFGNTLQLAAVDTTKIEYFSPARVFGNLWFYTVAPPVIKPQFPFVFLEPKAPPFPLPENFMFPEQVEGILWACPIVLLLPFAVRLFRGERKREFAACLAVLAGSGIVLMAFTASLSATMRYMADFSPLIAIAALVAWAALLDTGIRPKLVLAGFCGLAAFGMLNQFFIGFTGYWDSYKNNFPQQYHVVEGLFSPIADLLRAILN